MIVIILPSQHDAPWNTASERHNLGFYELPGDSRKVTQTLTRGWHWQDRQVVIQDQNGSMEIPILVKAPINVSLAESYSYSLFFSLSLTHTDTYKVHHRSGLSNVLRQDKKKA